MKHKFEQRATEILIEQYGCKDIDDLRNCFLSNMESETMIIEAMCQAMDSVKKSKTFYSIEQVEQLLQDQREMCAENAHIEEGHMVDDELFFLSDKYKEKDISEGFAHYSVRRVDMDSILNSKLKIK